tara:strand:+ start:525 stop:1313 length:789 start_codon:yes stop_codon:yes gene_type:complete
MGSLVGKSPNETYKSLLKVSDETNGITTSVSQIEDGEGTATCLSVSDDILKVKPQNDNTVTTFEVENTSGTNLLTVDTTNDCVKTGTTQTYVNTQILEFSAYRLLPVAGRHYFVPCASGNFAGNLGLAELYAGDGTDPDTTYDAGATSDDLIPMLFLAPYNLTIDGVKFMVSTDTDTDTTINVHLYKFTMTNAGGTSDGDLSSGTLLANGQATAVDRNVIKTVSASIDSSSVSANEVIACFVENETNTDDIIIKAQVLYHIN